MENKLTKNYILNYGWVYVGGFFFEFPIKNEIYIPEYSNRAVDFRLNFVDFDRYLKLEGYERSGFQWETCYTGKCSTEE